MSVGQAASRRSSRRIAKGSAGLLFAVALIAGVGATPANADAVGGSACPGGASVIGWYYTGAGARSAELLDCGSVGVRIGWRAHPGTPTQITAWTFNPTNAYRPNPGGQIYSNHRGTSQAFNAFFTLSD